MLPQPITPPSRVCDAAALVHVERQLARLIGPVAKLMVKRAAAATNDLDTLYRILAGELGENERAEFLDTVAPPHPTARPAASEWDPRMLKQVEHQLAQRVGPVAKLMVARAAACTSDIDKLYLALADQLEDDERASLYGARNSIAPPAPNEADAPAQHRLGGLVDPIARSLAGSYAASTSALHSAYHTLADRLSRKRPRVAVLEPRTDAMPRLHPMVAGPAAQVARRAALVARQDRLRTQSARARRSTVSRLLGGKERLRVRLSPGEVLAGGRSIACDPALGAEPWQGAVATLKAFEWTERCEVTAVLSNHFVRYAVVPWSDALSNAAEEEAYLRHHFAKIHGERAKTWTPRASEDRRGVPRLASAIDSALLEELKNAFPREGKASLVSVQPELMEAINRWRDAIPREGAWLVLAEPERACLAMYNDGGWRSVQNAKGDWLTLLERERFRLHEVPELVLLSGTSAPKESQGWQFRELAA